MKIGILKKVSDDYSHASSPYSFCCPAMGSMVSSSPWIFTSEIVVLGSHPENESVPEYRAADTGAKAANKPAVDDVHAKRFTKPPPYKVI